MSKQVIITVSREYGSGGLDISKILSEKLGVELFDKKLIEEIAKDMGMDPEQLEKYDEKPKNRIATRTVSGYSNSMEDILNEKQAEWLQEKVDSGDSFIVVGRLSNQVLRDNPGVVSIFVTGDEDYKLQRIMGYISADEKTAREEQARVDRSRRAYHNRYADHKWGDSRYYDIIINAGKLGVEETADFLYQYIMARIDAMDE